MSNMVFTGLRTPNDVLGKIRDFLVANDWTVLNNCTDDVAIDGTGIYDGKVLAVKKGDMYFVFRTANGKGIFEEQMNWSPGGIDGRAYGIGLTSCTAYTPNPSTGYWYDQPNVIVNNSRKVIGAGIAVPNNVEMKLYCNYTTDIEPCALFSVEISPGIYQHLSIGNVQKIGTWTGGAFISGSRSSYGMFPSVWTPDMVDQESSHLFGMSRYANTFVRIDVDAAPLRKNPVLWAASGPQNGNCGTGKILATPVVDLTYLNSMPKVPHYAYLQSKNAADYGRNVNTLNCISVNMPIPLFIQRDPDLLMNFSQIGYIPSIYVISMRNVASGRIYEINYPKSGNLHQVFPHIRRAGYYGYDGISIAQSHPGLVQ